MMALKFATAEPSPMSLGMAVANYGRCVSNFVRKAESIALTTQTYGVSLGSHSGIIIAPSFLQADNGPINDP